MLKRRLKEPFGKAGLVIAVIALVFAMVGGAYAAKGALTGKQKKEVQKIAKTEAKKYAGKPGTQGAPGTPGANGTSGTNGAAGDSPIGTAFSGNANGCTEGGVKFVGANTTAACNGVKGKNGTTGFTETLPSEKTETGVWSFGKLPTPEGGTIGPLALASFPIPLGSTASITPHLIDTAGKELHFEGAATSQTACLGSLTEPTAEPGNLCVYVQALTNINTGTEAVELVGKVGATIIGISEGEEPTGWGSWAVTAP